MQTPFGGGFGSPRGGGGAMAIQMELGQLKAAPVLNPHFGMVIKYLDCLNRLMDPLIMSNGPDGRIGDKWDTHRMPWVDQKLNWY
ncbi:hypothetical protein EHS25_003337 [Saitozyma podzolica]|uniref:Uncharacterized protein n=1 Tax=Saitozyma podzolica TaxID=1890683 RepID=A0A427Y8Y1_9TREE|nr:hypothetical protein EHS25_003337 [Saitozyma podzolica]